LSNGYSTWSFRKETVNESEQACYKLHKVTYIVWCWHAPVHGKYISTSTSYMKWHLATENCTVLLQYSPHSKGALCLSFPSLLWSSTANRTFCYCTLFPLSRPTLYIGPTVPTLLVLLYPVQGCRVTDAADISNRMAMQRVFWVGYKNASRLVDLWRPRSIIAYGPG